MNPNVPDDAQQAAEIDNPLAVMSPGEKVICQITRHPFGILGLYIVSAFIIVIVLAAAVLIPHYITSLDSSEKMGLFAVALLVSVITLLYVYVGSSIYKGNRWIVTSDSITQISQVGLFRKQTSQLSLANLEDVTFEQNNFIQTMFGFGLLKVETAGEHSKFTFSFCPRPAEYARQIIQAHEQYIAYHPEETHQANTGIVNTQELNPEAYEQQALSQQQYDPTKQNFPPNQS